MVSVEIGSRCPRGALEEVVCKDTHHGTDGNSNIDLSTCSSFTVCGCAMHERLDGRFFGMVPPVFISKPHFPCTIVFTCPLSRFCRRPHEAAVSPMMGTEMSYSFVSFLRCFSHPACGIANCRAATYHLKSAELYAHRGRCKEK